MSAYWIGLVEITDPERYQQYARGAQPIIEQYGGEILSRGGKVVSIEGEPPPPRVAVVRFPSIERAREFYQSDEYQAVKKYRDGAAIGRFFVVEGID